MNKKFTMMLAAFVAAGYTITAEAGVVKVSKPVNGGTYYITNVAVTKALNGESTAVEGNENKRVETMAITSGDLDGKSGLSMWHVTLNENGTYTFHVDDSEGQVLYVDNFSLDSQKSGSTVDEFNLVESNNAWNIVGTVVHTKAIHLTDNGQIVDANTGDKDLVFYAHSSLINNVKTIQIAGKYLSAKLDEDKAVLELVSAPDYVKNPVKWNANESGNVYVELGEEGKEEKYWIVTETPAETKTVTSGDELKLVKSETAPTAAAAIETLTQGTTTNLLIGGLYITSDLKLTEDETKAATAGTAANLDNVTLPSITSSDSKAVKDGISGTSTKIYAYSVSSKTEITEGYLLAENGKTTVASDLAEKEAKTYFWTINSNNEIVASDGTKLAVDSETKFTEIVSEDDDKVFFLYAGSKGFVKYDATNSKFVTTTDASLATPFSAIAEGYDGTPVKGYELTDEANGAFTLKYKIGNDEVASVLKDVTAIEITSFPVDKYAVGTYFVVDAPDDLAVSSTATYTKEVLNKLTFVAISPVKSSNFAYEDEGAGYTLTTVKGEDLVSTPTSEDNGEIAAANAVFVVNNGELNEGELVVAPKANFYVNSTTEAANGKLVSQSNSDIILAAMKGSNNSLFVATYNTTSTSTFDKDTKATLTSANVEKYSDFLGTSAKIFNIQFLSTSAYVGVYNSEGTLTYPETPTTAQKETYSECNKYLGIGETVSSTATMLAQGAAFVDLSLPQNQWIVTNMNKDDNTVTFTNRENTGLTFSAKLVKTDNANEYRLAEFDPSADAYYLYKDTEGVKKTVKFMKDTEDSNNLLVKLSPVTAGQNDGYVSGELSESETVKIVFAPTNSTVLSDLYLTVKDNAEENGKVVELNKEGAAQFEVIKTVQDKRDSHKTKFAILKDGAPAESTVKDTLSVVTYAFKYIDGTDTYYLSVNGDDLSITADNELKDDYQFMVKKLNNGKLALISYAAGTFDDTIDENTKAFDADLNAGSVTTEITEPTGFNGNSIYSADVDAKAYISFEGEKSAISLPAVSQHVLFNSNGAYMAVNENKAAVLDAPSALKAEYTKEQLTFWLDTVDSKAVVPTFYITKGSKEFMFNAADSLKYYNESSASQEKAEALQMPDNELNPRAIFRSASLVASDTLSTTINGAAKKLYAEEGIEAYQYKIVLKDEAVADEYVVRSVKDNSYLYESNGALGFVGDIKQAIVFNIESTEAPTSNEGVSASDVKVVAQNGSVVVMNAAGKNVVVSTILGQVVVNEVLTSDNATINVPAGIVVVAVEGESFKVNVK